MYKRQELVFKSVIGRGVRNREATFHGKTIFEHAPNDPASIQYLDLVKEMLQKRASVAPTRLPTIENGASTTLGQGIENKRVGQGMVVNG